MKQVLIRRGQIAVEDVPAPLIEPGHVLVEVAYSMISSGTEIGAIAGSGKSLFKRAIEQPDKVMKLMENLPNQGIKRTVADVQSLVGHSKDLRSTQAGSLCKERERNI
jgi:hypothetical protein